MSDVTPVLDLDDPTTDPFDVARAAAAFLAQATGVARHDVLLVLGSGWGGAADLLGETVAEVPSHEIPGFSAPAVAGHGATTRSIRIEGTDRHALVLGSRTHLYEGRGVRRPHRPLLVAPARGGPRDRPDPRRRRLRAVPRTALRDARRGEDGRR